MLLSTASSKHFGHGQVIFVSFAKFFSLRALFLCLLPHPVSIPFTSPHCRANRRRRNKFCDDIYVIRQPSISVICNDPPGLENMVVPPKAPSNIRIGTSTKRGPISTRVVCGGPLGCVGSFSKIWYTSKLDQRANIRLQLTWKFRIQIFESRIENVRTWSTKGLAFRAVGGTPNIFIHSSYYGGSHRHRILTWVKTSFVNRPHSVSSKAWSKLRMPRLPFRQLPVIFSSSIVCTFWTCSLILGPLGVLTAHM